MKKIRAIYRSGKADNKTPSILFIYKPLTFSFFTILILLNLKLISQPAISSFSPISGQIGSTVTIEGTNFSPNSFDNIVFFGPVKATVLSSTSTLLDVSVPAGAAYQPISVTNLSTNLTAYSSQYFDVKFPFCGIFDTSSFFKSPPISLDLPIRNVTATDFDGDGKPEIIVVTPSLSIVSVYRNISSDGNISFDSKVDFDAGSDPSDITIADFDGDGKPDFAITDYYTPIISVFHNLSTPGNISFDTIIEKNLAARPYRITSGDFDKDGKPDIALTTFDENFISILPNTSSVGNISFGSEIDIDFGGSSIGDITTCDLDGDKKPDLAINDIDLNVVSIFLNSSTYGNISFDFAGSFSTGKTPLYISTSDFNGDGKQEIITANTGFTSSASVLKNNSTIGNISFSPPINYVTGDIFGDVTNCLSSADMNGDGKPDLALLNYVAGSVSIFINNSTGNSILFSPNVDIHTGINPDYISISDLDVDGKPDLAIANYLTISLLRNFTIPPAPDICMVTVDSTSTNNIVYWSETQYNDYDSMIIYRETVSNVFKRIGAVSPDSVNFFVDTIRQLYFPYTGDPNMGSYKYKLQVRDKCGVYSELGPYHNTMYLTHNASVFTWNQYEIEGQAIPIPELFAYHLLRSVDFGNTWTLVGGVSGSQVAINDPDYDIYPDALRRIETQWSINCSGQKSTYNSSSNILGIPLSVSEVNTISIDIYPNPFTSETIIKSDKKLTDATLTLWNSYGNKVKQIKNIYGNTTILHRDELPPGLYYLQLSQKGKLIAKEKLIISISSGL